MRVVIEFGGIFDAGVADNIMYEVYKKIGKVIEFVIHEGHADSFSMKIEGDDYEVETEAEGSD